MEDAKEEMELLLDDGGACWGEKAIRLGSGVVGVNIPAREGRGLVSRLTTQNVPDTVPWNEILAVWTSECVDGEHTLSGNSFHLRLSSFFSPSNATRSFVTLSRVVPLREMAVMPPPSVPNKLWSFMTTSSPVDLERGRPLLDSGRLWLCARCLRES